MRKFRVSAAATVLAAYVAAVSLQPVSAVSPTAVSSTVTPATVVTTAHWYPRWSPSTGRGEPEAWPRTWPKPVLLAPTAVGPLTGRTVLVDAGHNSGNFRHLAEINRRVWVGLSKICNTTGTSTRGGYLESKYTFDVARRLTSALRRAGATVVLTRAVDGRGTYGPCVQARGLLAAQAGADVGVAIHADGGPSSGRGAFVYAPARLAGYTSRAKARASARLGEVVMEGLGAHGIGRSSYYSPTVDARRDQGTLNTSTVPIVIVETLNMANSRDAAIAESEAGRQRVADGLYDGIVSYFG